MTAYYIITAHNAEELIARVLSGIVKSHSPENKGIIILVADGCKDQTIDRARSYFELLAAQNIFSDIALYILELPDLHEIASLNHALMYIRTFMNPDSEDLVFMLQDDVVLDEPGIDSQVYEFITTSNSTRSDGKKIGYISLRMGVDIKLLPVKGEEYRTNIYDYNVTETEFGHWAGLGWTEIHGQPIDYLKRGAWSHKDVVVRSPTVCQWALFADIGVFDAALYPYNYDCFDFSIRALEKNYINTVFAMKFESKLEWGKMRVHDQSTYNAHKEEIFDRNLEYVMHKHRDFLTKYTTQKLEYEKRRNKR